ncbi:MAG TPA: DUF1445 domain-containing protein [Spirochaetia bacterium]|nr:DUF1445 domain-containing protein [Spirochaetia bacterium]
MTPAQEARMAMRRGEWRGPTVYRVPGYVQTNLVVLAKQEAYDFLVYCQRNARACPVIEVTDPGDPEPRHSAKGADLRSDLPLYSVYRNGSKEGDVEDIRSLWQPDHVCFLLGSSLSFDEALVRAGVARSEQVWAYDTDIQTVPSGRFHGPLVVTMRLMKPGQAVTATQLTSRYVYTHGAPIHFGSPEAIGIDLGKPIFGDPLQEIPSGMVPVFWACGVTPQRAALKSGVPLLISHAPGHGFITDISSDRFCIP